MSKHPLSEYVDVLDEMSDAEIAEMADVDVGEVAAYRASLAGDASLPPLTASEARDAIAATDDPDELAKWSKDPRRTVAAAAAKRAAALVQAKPPDSREPACVRVTVGPWRYIDGPNGQPMRISLRDVYSGALASFLWRLHRDIVEPYPLES